MKKIIYLAIGIILGCMITDDIYIHEKLPRIYSALDYGKLLMAIAERPEQCPICQYQFHYSFHINSEDFQRMIDEYLGE